MKDRLVPTTCVMDCPDACALEVSVVDGRIDTIRGRNDHPTTRGFICSKVAAFSRRVDHEARLLHPMKRRGAKGEGDFVRLSWKDAMGEITEHFQRIVDRWGGEAILPYHYGGSNGLLTDGLLDELFFSRLGASRLGRTICAAPTSAVAHGMYGKMPGVAFEDYPAARCIVVWGANPRASNIHLVPFLQEAKRRGAFIAVVDPRRNLSSEWVDLHLPVFPGTDLPVALSMIRHWNRNDQLDRTFLNERVADGVDELLDAAEPWSFERSAAAAGVRAEDVERLADAYAESTPALIRCGWGIERNRNGGRAVAAVLAMPALLGKFGVRGGGYTLSNSGSAKLDRARLWKEPRWQSRVINMTELGKVLTEDLEPPIRGLFVYNCNPVASVPDQNRVVDGLKREALFTVVFEQVMTDTARFADILLPATTFLEHRDVRAGYGSYVVGGVQAAIAPPGEARTNIEVFAALGRAMGFPDPAFSWVERTTFLRVAEALRLDGRPAQARPLESGGLLRFDFPGPTPVQFETVHPRTPDGKAHLAPYVLGKEPFVFSPLEDGEYPLALVTPATSRTINTTLGEWSLPELILTIHPSDATDRRIRDGDEVRVFNRHGAVVGRAQVTAATRRGVVVLPKGAWMKASRSGRTAVALCPATVNEVAGGACFNDARVEVEPIGARAEA